MSLKQMSSYLNLKVLLRKVEKNHSGIPKRSHLFLKTLKLNTLLSPNHHLFESLHDRERLNQLANFDQVFLQTSQKSNFPEDLLWARRWHLSPRWCLSMVFKHLLSLQAVTHCCRMPRYVEIPATASLPSWQKNPRKPKKTQLLLWKHGTREREYDGQAGECLCFLVVGFFLSSMKVSRYSAEKTPAAPCSCPGRREGSSRREKLSRMDTDDQKQTVIPRVAEVTRWSVMSWKEPFWPPGSGFLSRCFSAPATATPEWHRKMRRTEGSL